MKLNSRRNREVLAQIVLVLPFGVVRASCSPIACSRRLVTVALVLISD